MKILFVRHGESEDDLINAYGGWTDFPLTENGKAQIERTASSIKNLDVTFSKIISSPLSRAISTSKIIAKAIDASIEVNEYLKERNSYGIMSGMNKVDAKNKYPDQVLNLEKDLYVDGSERVEDLKARIIKALNQLKAQDKDIIVVTHGSFLKEMFKIFGKTLVKKEDGGFVLVEINGNDIEIVESDGIVLS